MFTHHLRDNIYPPLRRWTVAGVGLLTSALAWLSIMVLWQEGYAQTFTEEEISNYAAAVLAMEDMRVGTYTQISDLMTSEQLDVTRYTLRCLSVDALELPRVVRSQVLRDLITYCNDAQQVVQDSGLTVQLFNSITVTHQQDETLAEQIQLELSQRQ